MDRSNHYEVAFESYLQRHGLDDQTRRQVVDTLTLGARITVIRQEGSFAVTRDRGFLASRHLSELDDFERDFVAVAEQFCGTPYLWGGKTARERRALLKQYPEVASWSKFFAARREHRNTDQPA